MAITNAERRVFKEWTTANRDLLLASGIPLVAWESPRNWSYFFGHGCLPHEIDSSGFDVAQLNFDELVALGRLIEIDAQYGNDAAIMAKISTLLRSKRGS